MYRLPSIPTSPETLFESLRSGISVCQTLKDGEVELNIRRANNQELELLAYSFLGAVHCSPAALRTYLEEWSEP
jgi:hypothetical protein